MTTRREAYNPLLKSYPDSGKINSVSEGAEVVYIRLIAASDDAGRFYGDPEWVLAKLFTARMARKQISVAEMEKRLAELESVGLLARYAVNGMRYVQLLDVFKRLRKDVSPQVIFPEQLPASVTEPERPRNADVTLEPATEPATEPIGSCATSAELGSRPTSTAVIVSEFDFPTTGKGAHVWTLPQSKLLEYIESYPGLDVRAEMRKARQWCRDRPRQRKTVRGMLPFLTGWLNRAQNSAKAEKAIQEPQPGRRTYNVTSEDDAVWTP